MTPRQIILSGKLEQRHADPAHQYYKINVQQMAKNPVFLDALRAPPGFKLVQLDLTSAEDVILANLSKDATLVEVYGKGLPHDGYLYLACGMLDDDGKLAQVYKPDAVTRESVAAAKKQFKSLRNIAKPFKLMSSYKAGWRKIKRSLALNNIDLTDEQAQELYNKFWDMHAGVLEYEQSLLAEVAQRDGYMINDAGIPIVVTDHKEKDVINTRCQSFSHTCLDLLILYAEQSFAKAGVDAHPVVPDYHDETIWQVPAEQAEKAAGCLEYAREKMNDRVNLAFRLAGDAEITNDFTSFKGPDPVAWYAEKLGV